MGLFDFVDAIPVLGHIKGVIHYLDDDEEAGHRAMLAASRTSAVIGAGAVGMIGGPVLAAGAAAAVGAEYDLIVAAASDGKHVNGIAKVANNPTDPKAYLNAVLDTAGDALTGGAAGAAAKGIANGSARQVVNGVIRRGANEGVNQAAKHVGNHLFCKQAEKKIVGNCVERVLKPEKFKWSTVDEVLARAVAGDLIEFRRLKGTYCHWAVYVGNGYVINYGRQDPSPNLVQIELLATVSDGDPCRINNLVEEARERGLNEPFSGEEIVRRAEAELGREFPYNVLTNNCEVFATKCRYGRGFTCQPEQVIDDLTPGHKYDLRDPVNIVRFAAKGFK